MAAIGTPTADKSAITQVTTPPLEKTNDQKPGAACCACCVSWATACAHKASASGARETATRMRAGMKNLCDINDTSNDISNGHLELVKFMRIWVRMFQE
jgi:hypothetical protein